jgi:hypothetical protein
MFLVHSHYAALLVCYSNGIVIIIIIIITFIIFHIIIIIIITITEGRAVAQLVEAPRYKPEGGGFDYQ